MEVLCDCGVGEEWEVIVWGLGEIDNGSMYLSDIRMLIFIVCIVL